MSETRTQISSQLLQCETVNAGRVLTCDPAPRMTDLARFRALFDSVGMKYRAETRPAGTRLRIDELQEDGSVAPLDEGMGHFDFYFDPSGKFVSHGVWE